MVNTKVTIQGATLELVTLLAKLANVDSRIREEEKARKEVVEEFGERIKELTRRHHALLDAIEKARLPFQPLPWETEEEEPETVAAGACGGP